MAHRVTQYNGDEFGPAARQSLGFNHWSAPPGALLFPLGSRPACLSAHRWEGSAGNWCWRQSWTRRVSPVPPPMLKMSPAPLVLRSLQRGAASFPPGLPSAGAVAGPSHAGEASLTPRLAPARLEEPDELAVCPPSPIPPSPAPAWLGRCEGSDFTACQLRPKNTQNSEMLGQGEERAGTRDGVGGCSDNLAREALTAPPVLLEKDGQRSRVAPSGPICGNDKGGFSLPRTQLWHTDLREGSVSDRYGGPMSLRPQSLWPMPLSPLHHPVGWHLRAVGAGRVPASFLEKVPLLLGERCEEGSAQGGGAVPAGARCGV